MAHWWKSLRYRFARENRFVPDYIYNIGTTVLNGGVSMVIFFVVNKIIFPAEAPEIAS